MVGASCDMAAAKLVTVGMGRVWEERRGIRDLPCGKEVGRSGQIKSNRNREELRQAPQRGAPFRAECERSPSFSRASG